MRGGARHTQRRRLFYPDRAHLALEAFQRIMQLTGPLQPTQQTRLPFATFSLPLLTGCRCFAGSAFRVDAALAQRSYSLMLFQMPNNCQLLWRDVDGDRLRSGCCLRARFTCEAK